MIGKYTAPHFIIKASDSDWTLFDSELFSVGKIIEKFLLSIQEVVFYWIKMTRIILIFDWGSLLSFGSCQWTSFSRRNIELDGGLSYFRRSSSGHPFHKMTTIRGILAMRGYSEGT